MKPTLKHGISEVENTKTFQVLLKDMRELMENARQIVVAAVNTGLSILYCQVGERILKDILNEKRADYERQILPTLPAKFFDDGDD